MPHIGIFKAVPVRTSTPATMFQKCKRHHFSLSGLVSPMSSLIFPDHESIHISYELTILEQNIGMLWFTKPLTGDKSIIKSSVCSGHLFCSDVFMVSSFKIYIVYVISNFVYWLCKWVTCLKKWASFFWAYFIRIAKRNNFVEEFFSIRAFFRREKSIWKFKNNDFSGFLGGNQPERVVLL
jgi:hypothetical protein